LRCRHAGAQRGRNRRGGLAGLDKILDRMKILRGSYGDDFRPVALLERPAAEGKNFSSV
jgi:hypothetical protein